MRRSSLPTEMRMDLTIPPNKVPWDAAELKGRTCFNCACYFEAANQDDPKKFTGFCRRNIANLVELRGEVPRLDLSGKPVMREGKPVMNAEKIPVFVFALTQREGTCFDGYRAKGTLPGERGADTLLRCLGPLVLKSFKQAFPGNLSAETEKQLRQAFDLPLDDDAQH